MIKSKSNGLHRSINMALRYMKEIREKYIKSFLTKKEKILDVQDAMESLDNPRVLLKCLIMNMDYASGSNYGQKSHICCTNFPSLYILKCFKCLIFHSFAFFYCPCRGLGGPPKQSKYSITRRSGCYVLILLAPAEGWGPCGPCWGPSAPSRVAISKL